MDDKGSNSFAIEEPVVYPTGDGKPVAETELHFREIIEVVMLLDAFFRDRKDVYVCGNNFIYYEEGVPSSCISPDAYVVFGVPKRVRDSYFVWKEGGKVPAAIFEVTSPSTRAEDRGEKKRKCALMGVKEYFLYDPRAEYLTPALQGFRLEHGFYTPIVPDRRGRLQSRALGLDISLDNSGKIELFDRKTGRRLLRRLELDAQLADEKRARRKELNARRKAVAEIVQLKAELARMKESGAAGTGNAKKMRNGG
jgi:Uma2 family endonuclease